MLDIPRLERIELTRNPLMQRFVGRLLLVNYRLLPGVQIDFEGNRTLPDEPVIFAMNHTDRYNYFPFQLAMWRRYNRFTATWVKGKYYEHPFVASFMEKTNQLPTVSRGYLITKDFLGALGRTPTTNEYNLLRQWADAVSHGRGEEARPPTGQIPEEILTQPRDILGHPFEPEKEDYAGYINTMFHIMMRRFIGLNRRAPEEGLDLLIFPQGTRSVRLLPSHIGISQIALHLKIPVVPVGCNGTDALFPAGNPWAKKGRAIYRFGAPISYADLAEYHTDEEFEPFTPDAEERYQDRFRAMADMITDRIDALLDERYKRDLGAGVDVTRGADRFV